MLSFLPEQLPLLPQDQGKFYSFFSLCWNIASLGSSLAPPSLDLPLLSFTLRTCIMLVMNPQCLFYWPYSLTHWRVCLLSLLYPQGTAHRWWPTAGVNKCLLNVWWWMTHGEILLLLVNTPMRRHSLMLNVWFHWRWWKRERSLTKIQASYFLFQKYLIYFKSRSFLVVFINLFTALITVIQFILTESLKIQLSEAIGSWSYCLLFFLSLAHGGLFPCVFCNFKSAHLYLWKSCASRLKICPSRACV